MSHDARRGRAARLAPAVIAGLSLAAAAGCRPDPGNPAYIDDAAAREERLTVGAFYVGSVSDAYAIDDTTRHLYIFGTPLTLTIDQVDSADRSNSGQPSYKITHAGTGFWGMGIFWDQPVDLSRWSTMHVSFKSSAASATFSNFQIGVQSVGDTGPENVDAAKYGFANDDQWHELVIPVADFVAKGYRPAAPRSPFVLGGGAGQAGDWLKVAGLYFSPAGGGAGDR